MANTSRALRTHDETLCGTKYDTILYFCPSNSLSSSALKRFVLLGGWRNARYVHEPRFGPTQGILNEYAIACERIAYGSYVSDMMVLY